MLTVVGCAPFSSFIKAVLYFHFAKVKKINPDVSMLSSLRQREVGTGLQHKVRVDLKYNCMSAK